MKDCEEAFQKLKEHLVSMPLLCRIKLEDSLLLYVAILDSSVSSILIIEEEGRQQPVYYVSRALMEAEKNYLRVKKVAFVVMITT